VSDGIRIGLIVPSSNTTMETELPSLLRAREQARPAERFTFHSSRVRMRHVTPEELAAMNERTETAATELADMHPDVVATACLIAIMAQGQGSHCAAEGQIAETLAREGAPAPVVSSAGALISALHALQARRVAVLTPYMKPLTEKVVAYLADAGVEVHDAISLEVADNRAVAALDPRDLLQHWRKLDLTRCQALVVSCCVQMRSLEVVEAIEAEAGIPTLSAATATAWAILEALGRDAVAPRAGALLAARDELALAGSR
jgi:maleate isomerase